MKNVFAMNSQRNFAYDGGIFISDRVDVLQTKESEEIAERADTLSKEERLPLLLGILRFITGLITFGSIIGITRSIGELTLQEIYHNAPVLITAAPVCAVIFIVLTVMERKKQKKVLASDEFQEFESDTLEHTQEIRSILGVPENAVDMDVLTYTYKLKNDVPKIKSAGFWKYTIASMWVYVKNNALCFADWENAFSVPIEEISGIIPLGKKLETGPWNKEESVKDKRFKQYKISENNYGTVFMKPDVLQIHSRYGEFEIYLPPYETDTLRRLLAENGKQLDLPQN